MLTHDALIPIVDSPMCNILVAAENTACQVRVEYLGSKSFAGNQHTTVAPHYAETASVPANGVKVIRIDTNHAAFADAYGTVRLTSYLNGSPSSAQFSAWLVPVSRRDEHPASGAGLIGTSFEIPRAAFAVQTLRLAIVNASGHQENVVVADAGGSFSRTVSVKGHHTYLWDSGALAQKLDRAGVIEIHGGDRLGVAGVFTRADSKVHVRPVKID